MNISEGRVLKGKSLQAAIDHANKATELAAAIDEAQAAQIRFALRMQAELMASFTEMENTVKEDLRMTDEEFAGWHVIFGYAPSTNVAMMVKIEAPKQLDLNPKTGLN
jgi:hypothetical protein